MQFSGASNIVDLILEAQTFNINEMDITMGVFPIKSTLRNSRPILTLNHATNACKERTSPFLSMLVLNEPLMDWQDVVNTMVTEILTPPDITKITKLLQSRGESKDDYVTVKLTKTRLANAPDGNTYKGEISVVLSASWPYFGNMNLTKASKMDIRQNSYKIADPSIDPDYKDKVASGELRPLTAKSFNNLNLSSWVFTIIGYGGKYGSPKNTGIYKNPADFVKDGDPLPPINIGQKEHDALVKYSKLVDREYSYFR